MDSSIKLRNQKQISELFEYYSNSDVNTILKDFENHKWIFIHINLNYVNFYHKFITQFQCLHEFKNKNNYQEIKSKFIETLRKYNTTLSTQYNFDLIVQIYNKII